MNSIMTTLISPVSHNVCDLLGIERNKYGLVTSTADLLHKYTKEYPVDQSIVNKDTYCYFNFYVNRKNRPILKFPIATDPIKLALYECRFAQASPLPTDLLKRLPLEKALEYEIDMMKNNCIEFFKREDEECYTAWCKRVYGDKNKTNP
jgi:hypothetical protein